jgi:hypothetical protein
VLRLADETHPLFQQQRERLLRALRATCSPRPSSSQRQDE